MHNGRNAICTHTPRRVVQKVKGSGYILIGEVCPDTEPVSRLFKERKQLCSSYSP